MTLNLSKYTVLDIDPRKGSFSDKFWHTVTNNSVTMWDWDRGMAGIYNWTSWNLSIANSSDFVFGDWAWNDIPFTIECYAKITDLSAIRWLVSRWYSDWLLYTYNGNRLRFVLYDVNNSNYLSSFCPLTNNAEMLHIVATYNASKVYTGMKLYINWISQTLSNGNTGVYTGMRATQTPTTIWRTQSGSQYQFGRQSRTRILKNKAVSQNEINLMYAEFLQSRNIKKAKRVIKMKPNELRETWLVAAYNMNVIKWVINDISGNWNTLIPQWAVQSITDWALFSGQYYSYAYHAALPSISKAYDFSVCGTVKVLQDKWCCFFENCVNGTNDRVWVGYEATNKVITFENYTWSTNYANGAYRVWSKATFCAIKSWATYSLWINWVLQTWTTNTWNTTNSSGTGLTVGAWTYWYFIDSNTNGEIHDMRFYNRAITPAECRKYHNSQINTYIETFENNGADGTSCLPEGRSQISGTRKIGELTANDAVLPELKKGTKYIEWVSAWMMSMNWNSGVWVNEIYFYKTNNSATSYWFPVATSIADYNNSTNTWYVLYFEGTYLDYYRSYAASLRRRGNVNTIGYNTWYQIKQTTTTAGVRTTYIRGWAYWTNYVLYNSLSLWANPDTDLYNFVCKNQMVYLSGGDRITIIKDKDGIPA